MERKLSGSLSGSPQGLFPPFCTMSFAHDRMAAAREGWAWLPIIVCFQTQIRT